MSTPTQTQTRPAANTPPISAVQKSKLIELETTLRGGEEIEVRNRLNQIFTSAYEIILDRSTYEQAARVTGQLLAELRNQTAAQKAAPTMTQPSAPPTFQVPPQPPAPNAEPTPSATAPTPQVVGTESPYSVNFFAVSPAGFRRQYTIRTGSAEGIMARADWLEAALVKQGFLPVQDKAPFAPSAASSPAPAEETAPLCNIHGTPMKSRQGKNGSFFSCPQKLDDGSWCPGKPKK